MTENAYVHTLWAFTFLVMTIVLASALVVAAYLSH